MQRMVFNLFILGFLLLASVACDLEENGPSDNIGVTPPPADGSNIACDDIELSADEEALYRDIMNERSRHKLPQIPLSPALTYVAQTHADDIAKSSAIIADECNLHSWNSSRYWSGCCYTTDHAEAACMWDKPFELAGFRTPGYEIAYKGLNNPDGMLDAWLNSPGHADVILNRNGWRDRAWYAIGIGISDNDATGERYAYVWFAERRDCE